MTPDKSRTESLIANSSPRSTEALAKLTPLLHEATCWLEDEQNPQAARRDDDGELVSISHQKLVELLISGLHILKEYFGINSVAYSQLEKLNGEFSDLTKELALSRYVGILESVKKGIHSGLILGSTKNQSMTDTNIEMVINVLKNFSAGANRLLNRSRADKKGKSYTIDDEYDVQDLLYAILKPLIPDLNEENPTPKSAGDSGRIDLCSKENSFIIEIKYAKDKDRSKKLALECRDRILKYKDYPGLKWMLLFFYDPQHSIDDRHNFQNELSATKFTWNEISFQITSIISP